MRVRRVVLHEWGTSVFTRLASAGCVALFSVALLAAQTGTGTGGAGKTSASPQTSKPVRPAPAAPAPAAPAVKQVASTPAVPDINAKALVDQYCVTCHNERLKTGGLVLEGYDFANFGAHTERGELI